MYLVHYNVVTGQQVGEPNLVCIWLINHLGLFIAFVVAGGQWLMAADVVSFIQDKRVEFQQIPLLWQPEARLQACFPSRFEREK